MVHQSCLTSTRRCFAHKISLILKHSYELDYGNQSRVVEIFRLNMKIDNGGVGAVIDKMDRVMREVNNHELALQAFIAALPASDKNRRLVPITGRNRWY